MNAALSNFRCLHSFALHCIVVVFEIAMRPLSGHLPIQRQVPKYWPGFRFFEHEQKLHILRRVLPLQPASKIDIDVSNFRCSFSSIVSSHACCRLPAHLH